jgi:hypothetical protein
VVYFEKKETLTPVAEVRRSGTDDDDEEDEDEDEE